MSLGFGSKNYGNNSVIKSTVKLIIEPNPESTVRLFIYLIISESGVQLMINKCKPSKIVSTLVAEGRYYGWN